MPLSRESLTVPDHRPEYGDVPGWAIPSSDPRRLCALCNGSGVVKVEFIPEDPRRWCRCGRCGGTGRA